jgi:hypothetical protein
MVEKGIGLLSEWAKSLTELPPDEPKQRRCRDGDEDDEGGIPF